MKPSFTSGIDGPKGHVKSSITCEKFDKFK